MTDNEFSADFRGELDALLRLRRDVRHFRPIPIDPDVRKSVFDSMKSAPSVGLSQPTRVVRFLSSETRAEAKAVFERSNAAALAAQSPSRATRYAAMKLSGMDVAPEQFAVFCDSETRKGAGLGRETMRETLQYSCVCAIMQCWLVARSHNLGLGWVSILDPEAMRTIARAPASWTFIGYFCLGYPEREADDTPQLERADWERRDLSDDFLSAV